jgi:hypothetical protein
VGLRRLLKMISGFISGGEGIPVEKNNGRIDISSRCTL